MAAKPEHVLICVKFQLKVRIVGSTYNHKAYFILGHILFDEINVWPMVVKVGPTGSQCWILGLARP